MSATEDDTELRDLLIQNLESSGVLNRLKAEMRAAVFLALEEQDKLENKSPLVNESLKKCLNTEDGRLVAGLIVDFLQVFHLDFSLAVFQPETNSMNNVDRQLVCSKLGLCESDPNRTSPLLLELVRRQRHTHTSTEVVQEDAHTQGPCEDGRSSQADWKDAAAARGSDKQQQALDSRSCGGLDDPDEGEDSFFDDPLPKPDRTYGWKDDGRTRDQESDRRPAGSPEGNRSALTSRDKRPLRNVDDRTGSLHLDDDVEYDDDFNSHRSDFSKSELSIGEEIEEVSIEGPENSDKCDDTQDLSVSQLSQSHADYMEDVS